MAKKTKNIKKKKNIKKNKYLFLILITILLVIITLIFLYKNDKNSFSQPSENYSGNLTKAPTQIPFLIPISKKVTPLFEISTDSQDKNTIWSFVRENYELQDNVYKNGESFVPFIIKNDKSKPKINLIGFDTTTADIQSGSKRLIAAKKIENLIISLGYKQIKIGDKTDSFEIVDTYENMNRTIFLKEDQIFSVYYQQGNCEEVTFGGCYIRVSYFNNIEKQILSQLEVLNNLIGFVFDEDISSSFPFRYIENFPTGKKINEYIVFLFGKYNSDATLILAKEKDNGSLEIVLDGYKLDTTKFSEIPKDVLCTFFSIRNNGEEEKDLSIIEKCK